MVLVDWQIKEAIAAGDIKISPLDLDLINPCSLDIRLGGTIGIPRHKPGQGSGGCIAIFNPLNGNHASYNLVDPKDPETFDVLYKELDEYIIKPNEFILASMLESVELAANIMATLKGKSSIGRLGLGNSHQAGLIDGGWFGVLTMELHNSSEFAIKLSKGMKIGQLVFQRTEIPEKHYGIVGRYNNQKPSEGSKGV